MRLARRNGVPFWPAASVLDIPILIFIWQDIAIEAEEMAAPQLEARARRRADADTARRALASQHRI
jgi:hypothetical protein